jgi:hypothetical protein
VSTSRATLADGMPSAPKSALANPADFQVRRPDTLQFSTLDGLSRMSGVPRHLLRRLIAKEVTDNALDASDAAGCPGNVMIRCEDDLYVVSDEGHSIPGDAAALADLFSTGRPMLSGKFLRLPSRGALGNGLRVLVA